MAEKTELKTVVITGGATGIGYKTAETLLKTGSYKVILAGHERPKLEEAQKQLSRLEGAPERSVQIVTCDLRQESQITKAIEKILDLDDSIYGLVNNAGIYPFGSLENTTSADWDQTLLVNLKAPFLFIQGLAKTLAKHPSGGRIVNLSSTAGMLPNHFALAYSVSKAALIQLTKTLAKELGKDNINVNCVCPGIVRSPMHEAYHRSDRELEDFYLKKGAGFPLGRVGEPTDVANAIEFLLSEKSSWITGEVMVIDGGRLLL